MSHPPDSKTDSSAAQAPTDQAPVSAGWRLVGWAIVWCLAASAAAAIAGAFVGAVVGATGLQAQLGLANATSLYALAGGLGSQILMVCVALRKSAAAEHGDTRAGIGNHTIIRPMVVVLICVIVMAYSAAINLGIFNAFPQALRRAASVSWWVTSGLFLIAAIGAPLAEELFFRGWLWTGLRKKWSPLTTALVTSVMWLALHLPEGMARAILLLPLMIALPLARHFGGSVRASIIVHACNNAIAVATPWLAVWLGWLARP